MNFVVLLITKNKIVEPHDAGERQRGPAGLIPSIKKATRDFADVRNVLRRLRDEIRDVHPVESRAR